MAVYETAGGFAVDVRDAFGKRKRFVVGSRQAAEAIEANLRGQARETRAQLATFQTTTNLTVLELFEAWQATRFIQAKSKYNELRRLRQFLKSHAATRATEVSPATLAGHIAMRATQLSPAALYQEGRIIRNMFTWASDQLRCPVNPAKGLKLPQPRSAPGMALTAEQEGELIEVLTPRMRVRAVLALDAGLARIDIGQITRGQIDFEQRTVTYHRHKTHMLAVIPMTARILAELKRYCGSITAPDARLFKVNAQHNDFLKTAMPKLSFTCRNHDLRHTFISRVAATGCRQRITQALAGHSPQTPTERYDHPTLEELRRVIAAMEGGTKL